MLSTKTTNAIRAAVAAATLSFAGVANAGLISAIDTFTVTRNGAAFFQDTFTDGAPPPGMPAGNGSLTYSTTGASGIEVGGKDFVNSANGAYVNAGDGTARLRSITRLNSNIDPTSPNGLKSTSTFTVTGLFDLVVGDSPRDGFAIDLADTTGPAFGVPTAGQVWSIFVSKGTDLTNAVRLVLQDYTAHTITVVASVALDLVGHDQILLEFNRDNLSNNLAHSSFEYFNGGVASGGFIALGDATIFQSQNYTRAQFTTQQETPVVPLPGTLWLLFAGAAGLFSFRRTAA